MRVSTSDPFIHGEWKTPHIVCHTLHTNKYSNKRSELEILVIIRDIVSGLEYLHKNGFAHCDVKGENVVVVDGRAKLIDFSGLYKVNARNLITASTVLFLPLGKKTKYSLTIVEALHENKFGCFTDIWAVGILSCMLLLGIRSMWSDQPESIIMHIKNDDHFKLIPDSTSEQLRLVILACFSRYCLFYQ